MTTTTHLTGYPADHSRLITAIYNGFASRNYLKKDQISIQECASALENGRLYHRGHKSLKPFLEKTIEKINQPHSTTHIGTFTKIRELTNQKIVAAITAARQRYINEVNAERVHFENQLKPLKDELKVHQGELSCCQENATNLNTRISALQTQKEAENQELIELNEKIQNLSTQINQAGQNSTTLLNLLTEQRNALDIRGRQIREMHEKLDQLKSGCQELDEQNQRIAQTHKKVIKVYFAIHILLAGVNNKNL